MIFRSLRYVMGVLIVVLGAACDKAGLKPEEDSYLYPLSVGNTWAYNVKIRTGFLEENGAMVHYDSSYAAVSVEIDSLGSFCGRTDVYRFCEERLGEAGRPDTTFNYYKNVEDHGLFLYSYENPNWDRGSPKPNSRSQSNSEWAVASVPGAMPSFVDQAFWVRPIWVLNYPLRPNRYWSDDVDGDEFRYIIRKMDTLISVPAGRYDCFMVIRTHEEEIVAPPHYIPFSTVSLDYISMEGLIKRIVIQYAIVEIKEQKKVLCVSSVFELKRCVLKQ